MKALSSTHSHVDWKEPLGSPIPYPIWTSGGTSFLFPDPLDFPGDQMCGCPGSVLGDGVSDYENVMAD